MRLPAAVRLFACAVAASLCVAVSTAQTAVDGAIAGHIVPAASSAAATRVTVRALDGPNPTREVPVARDGSFLVLRLEPGEYVVEASLLGRVLASDRVLVELGQITEVSLGSSHTPVPPPEASTVSDVNETDERTADSTREDTADVTTERRQTGTNVSAATLLSFRGIAPTQNASLLDGLSGDQEFRGGTRGSAPGGPRAQTNFSEGAVRAFRIAPHNYAAQYGGAASGLLATASLSGTTTLRGGGSYTLRNSAFDAANPFSLVTHYRDGAITNSLAKPHDSLQQAGVRLGGPLPAKFFGGHAFAFASIEQQWRNFPAIATPSIANFYALTPTQIALLGNRGVSAVATNTALNYLDSLTGQVPRTANRSLQFARFDLQPSPRNHISISYARERLSSPAGTGSGASTAVVARGAASVGDETIRTDAFTARWLHFLSPRLTNELRAQYARDLEFETPRPPLPQEPAIAPGGFAPEVNIAAGQFLYGTPATLGRKAYPDERRIQLADIAQAAFGRHLLALGGDFSRIDERIDALNNLDGTFTYDSVATGGRAGGLVDWITDATFNVNVNPNGACPSINAAIHDPCFRSYTQSFGQQQVAFALQSFAAFAQDLWRIRPGLTLELGARYEYTLLPLPQAPNISLDTVFAATGTTSTFPEDRNNAGPRLAIAWSPHEARWGTLRLGYGAYFGRIPGSTVRAALLDTALPSTVTRIRITPTTVTACPQIGNQGFGYPCAYVSTPPAAVAATTSAAVFAKNFRLPVVQQAELTFERTIANRTILRATYSTALATQLPNSTDINIAPSLLAKQFILQGGDGRIGVQDGETFVVPAYTARLATQFGPVTAIESNANATFHGLTGEARTRLPGGVTTRASYTWSKALDFGAEQGTTPRTNGQFDPFNVRYDKARADADFPHRFTGDATTETRLHRGPRELQHTVSGWRLAASASAGSGRPYSYEIFGGTRLSGGSESINGSGGSAYLPTVGRNTLRLPVRWNVDARAGRGFRLTGKLHGEAYVEAFNLANHLNATRINARAFLVGTTANGITPLVFQSASAIALEGLNTPAFGTVTSSSAGNAQERRLQLGVRFEF